MTTQLSTTELGADAAGVAMDAVRRIVRALRTAHVESRAIRGASMAQLFVLREIDKAGVITIGELAARTATAQSSVSAVVARLASRGLIVRGTSPEDRRRAAISLSEDGRGALASAPETVQERLIAAFRQLPVDRQRTIADGMDEWIAAAGFGHVAATMFFEPVLPDLTD
ncbi:MAG TPA: MarR family transcriptional regulator [Gemmatimonadaceae bacterium]|nr:MarR family transcriptional regulator [Gemmatimonadaceae bacterium]